MARPPEMDQFSFGNWLRMVEMVCLGPWDALGITSNRISFCLGLQGPSFTMDAQGAASLAALTNGAMSLRLQTEHYKPNHTALVGGVWLGEALQKGMLC